MSRNTLSSSDSSGDESSKLEEISLVTEDESDKEESGKNSKTVEDNSIFTDGSDDEVLGKRSKSAANESISSNENDTSTAEQKDAEDKSKEDDSDHDVSLDTSVLENVVCTACGKKIDLNRLNAFHEHTELGVLICTRCDKFLKSGEITKDDDGDDEQCRWCGQGGKLVICDCHNAFCQKCIGRNFSKPELNRINNEDNWECFICDKSSLKDLQQNYKHVRDAHKAEEARNKRKTATPTVINGREKRQKRTEEVSATKRDRRRANKAAVEKVTKTPNRKQSRNSGKESPIDDDSGKSSKENRPLVKGKKENNKLSLKLPIRNKSTKIIEDNQENIFRAIQESTKVPATIKRKALVLDSDEEEEDDGDAAKRGEKSPVNRSNSSKPGPKRSKVKRKNPIIALSSDEERDDSLEDEDLVPLVFLCSEGKKQTSGSDEEKSNHVDENMSIEGDNKDDVDDGNHAPTCDLESEIVKESNAAEAISIIVPVEEPVPVAGQEPQTVPSPTIPHQGSTDKEISYTPGVNFLPGLPVPDAGEESDSSIVAVAVREIRRPLPTPTPDLLVQEFPESSSTPAKSSAGRISYEHDGGHLQMQQKSTNSTGISITEEYYREKIKESRLKQELLKEKLTLAREKLELVREQRRTNLQ